ncbi:beta-galactosidase trimerization domain-containing protein, partial [Parabacteroides distasonis]
EEELSAYRMVITPALYAASEELLTRLRNYADAGGVLVATFKTGFADEYVKVYHDLQPHGLTDVFGVHYHEFTFPKQVGLCGALLAVDGCGAQADTFMELLETDTAEVLLNYAHAYW